MKFTERDCWAPANDAVTVTDPGVMLDMLLCALPLASVVTLEGFMAAELLVVKTTVAPANGVFDAENVTVAVIG